jgi:GTP-binding protein EngB required for normal cell division
LEKVNKLKVKVHQPCILAVGGRVKAGKSTFLNTLLGENLALVGERETTATINRFVYGTPINPAKPIKVVYKNGVEEYVSKSFMDALQNNDSSMEKQRKTILYFEHTLPHPILKDITLVDTPGTDAVVSDHQEAAEKAFFGNTDDKELRAEHNAQTKELVSKADAVIYLVGAVANSSNQKFLDNFKQACDGASALNAIGIISRIDEEEQLLMNSAEQAKYVANSLREQVCNVLPVSACLYSVLKGKSHLFSNWKSWLSTIPEEALNYITRTEGAWKGSYDTMLKRKFPDLLNVEVRSMMNEGVPWGVFRAIIKKLYVSSVDVATSELYQLANFDEVKKTLQEQFFNRSKAIRCTVILNELNKLLLQIRHESFSEMRITAYKALEWKKLINEYISPKNQTTAKEIADFINKNIKSQDEISKLEQVMVSDLVRPIENLILEIQTVNIDYKMLELVRKFKERFSEENYQELCELFGLFGKKPNKTAEEKMNRQMYWQGKSLRYADSQMREIASYAVAAYGKL